jgi:hypothetical protein
MRNKFFFSFSDVCRFEVHTQKKREAKKKKKQTSKDIGDKKLWRGCGKVNLRTNGGRTGDDVVDFIAFCVIFSLFFSFSLTHSLSLRLLRVGAREEHNFSISLAHTHIYCNLQKTLKLFCSHYCFCCCCFYAIRFPTRTHTFAVFYLLVSSFSLSLSHSLVEKLVFDSNN